MTHRTIRTGYGLPHVALLVRIEQSHCGPWTVKPWLHRAFRFTPCAYFYCTLERTLFYCGCTCWKAHAPMGKQNFARSLLTLRVVFTLYS